MYNFDAKKVKEELIQWISGWFEVNGKGCNCIVGCSGGKDSSIVASLCVEALGKDRVIGVLMPNGEQADISESYKLVKHLDIEYHVINIFDTIRTLKHEIKPSLHDRWSVQTSTNLPARIRMCTLYAVAQTLNGRVSNNCNLSEDWVGYATRYGDGAGDFSPLANLTVTEVKLLGHELGLPYELVEKVPIDGLCDKTDEDNLGFTYEVLDKYIRTGEIDDLETKAKIDEMHKKNLFKLKPIPSFEFEPTFIPKFKVGDVVEVLDGSKIEGYLCGWVESMNKYVGKHYEIIEISDERSTYRLNNRDSVFYPNGLYCWDERGLKLVE